MRHVRHGGAQHLHISIEMERPALRFTAGTGPIRKSLPWVKYRSSPSAAMKIEKFGPTPAASTSSRW
jgi:hypothetical protein